MLIHKKPLPLHVSFGWFRWFRLLIRSIRSFGPRIRNIFSNVSHWGCYITLYMSPGMDVAHEDEDDLNANEWRRRRHDHHVEYHLGIIFESLFRFKCRHTQTARARRRRLHLFCVTPSKVSHIHITQHDDDDTHTKMRHNQPRRTAND